MNTQPNQKQSFDTHNKKGGITEIVTTSAINNCQTVFLPSFNQFYETNRWLCFIDTPYLFTPELINQHGISTTNSLVIKSNGASKSELIKRLLTHKNCSAIAIWLDINDLIDIENLRFMSESANTEIIIFRTMHVNQWQKKFKL